MKIVCVDDKLKGYTKPTKISLTIGKVYETKGGPPAMYEVTCDDGVVRDYSISRFVTLEEWREEKLNILGYGEKS